MDKNTLTKEEIESLHELFNFYDKSGTGTIPTSDVRNILKGSRFAVEGNALKRLVSAADPKDCGAVTFPQLLSGLQLLHPAEGGPREELLSAFRLFDKQNTGLVDVAELIGIMAKIKGELGVGEDEIAQLVREADFDRDGKIDYQEFVRTLFEIEQLS